MTAELSAARRALLQRYLRGGNAGAEATGAWIPLRTSPGPAPLSFSQQQIFIHSQLAGEALIYNEPITIHRHGALDVSALERSFTAIVQRHEAWRTTFEWAGDQGVQIVRPAPARIEIPVVELRAHAEPEREAIRLATEDARQPFDLAHGPMYRLRLVSLGEDEHRLFLTLHHIIFDGVSLYRVLLPELLACYEAFAKGETPALAPLPIQYPDYAAWQRDSIKEIAPEHLSYWRTVCTDLPVLNLTSDRPRPRTQTYAGAMELLQIPARTTAALKALSQEQNTTPFMTMVAAFMALLHGYSGDEDIVIGGVSSGRRHSETMGLLGCFLNTVPIRCAFSKDSSFVDLLARVRIATLGALSHDEVPFEFLVQKFADERDCAHAPIVQVLIVVEPPLEPLASGWDFTHMDVDTGTTKFDLQLGLDDRAEGLAGRFIYNTDLFDQQSIALLRSRWLQLLDRIVAAPHEPLTRLVASIWSGHASPAEWNGAQTAYPRDSTIHALFEEQTTRTPSTVALVFGEQQVTYDELNRRANRLARRLQARGVARDRPVAVCMERSIEMVIALLAILKAGGAYVPLDPTYPTERIGWMLGNSDACVILTQQRTGHPERSGAESKDPVELPIRIATGSLDFARDDRVLCVDIEDFSNEADTNLTNDARAEDLAYIIYTSGSTGRPKGVAIPHRAVVRLVQNTDYASFAADETFLQLAPISFDASTFELWGPLLNGGKLVLMSPATPTLEEIGGAIRQHGVTTLWLTSALFNAMIDERLHDLRPLRQLLAGGDVLSVRHVRTALRELKDTRLINGYGPTESTTFACCHTISHDESLGAGVPIGRPIANTTAYILDAQLEPVAVGVSGELFLGGDGLARGYWRDEKLTAEKFIVDPFSDEPRARLYRTGDLARWRGDGTIQFLGRVDGQIKIRGFRIEPGEIEAALKQQAEVLDAAVVVREDLPNEKRLVAYVVSHGGATINPSTLIAALRASLPDYMIPAAVVALPALPRTANGKLDRAALPRPNFAEDFVAPASPLEEKLAAIWVGVLGVPRVGRSDNFFELGGHSLLGLRLANQVRENLGYEMPLAMIFEAPTVAALAQLLERRPAPATTLPLAPIVSVNRDSRRARRS